MDQKSGMPYRIEENLLKIFYIQVTYLLQSKEVIEREYGNLEKIKDNWPKIVVSLDEVSFPDRNGIQHVPAWKFATFLSDNIAMLK